MTYTVGLEMETHGVSITRVQNAIDRAGIRGVTVKPDGTPNVDAEIVLPPLGNHPIAYDYIRDVCRVLENLGCEINRSCGLHVHISNAPLTGTNAADYTGASIAEFHNTGNYLASHGEPLDAVIVKDIMQRYERQQDTINTMLARSRTHNRYCAPLDARRLENATTIQELNHGKFTRSILTHGVAAQSNFVNTVARLMLIRFGIGFSSY